MEKLVKYKRTCIKKKVAKGNWLPMATFDTLFFTIVIPHREYINRDYFIIN